MVYIMRVLYCLLAYLHKGAMFSLAKWLQNFMLCAHNKQMRRKEKQNAYVVFVVAFNWIIQSWFVKY